MNRPALPEGWNYGRLPVCGSKGDFVQLHMVKGGLGVRCIQKDADYDLSLWAITHAGTGLRVAFADGMHGAIEAVEMLIPLWDWSSFRRHSHSHRAFAAHVERCGWELIQINDELRQTSEHLLSRMQVSA